MINVKHDEAKCAFNTVTAYEAAITESIWPATADDDSDDDLEVGTSDGPARHLFALHEDALSVHVQLR